MSASVFLCNLALANVAKPSIQDINGPEPEAQACKLFYNHVLDVLLQSHPWRWAGQTVALAEVTNTKAGKWQYAGARPANCLKLRYITDSQMADRLAGGDSPGEVTAGNFAYEVEGQTIFSNLSPAYAVFTATQDDPSVFPPLFEEAFGWHLAVRLSMPLTRDPKVRADAYQLAVKTSAAAEVADANEVRETSNTPAEAIEVRS